MKSRQHIARIFSTLSLRYQKVKAAYITVLCISVCLFGYFLYERHSWVDIQKSAAKNAARSSAFEAAKQLGNTLKVVEGTARTLSHELNTGSATMSNLDVRLKAISQRTSLIFGLGVAYQPKVLQEWVKNNPARQAIEVDWLNKIESVSTPGPIDYCSAESLRPYMLAPYYRRDEIGGMSRSLVLVNHVYDYTCPGKYWYLCPLGLDPVNCPSTQTASWLEPYYGQASGLMVEEFSMPFYSPELKKQSTGASGVVWANLSLSDFNKLMASMNISQHGYGFLLSPDGRFISHPSDEYIKSKRSIQDEQVVGGDNLGLHFDRALLNGMQEAKHIDPISGLPAIWIFEPIPRTKWVLGLVYNNNSWVKQPKVERIQLIKICMSLIVILLCTSLLLIQLLPITGVKCYWMYSLGISSFLLIAIACSWYIVALTPVYKDGIHTSTQDKKSTQQQAASERSITSEWQVNTFKKRITNAHPKDGTNTYPPVFLPTGVFVQSLDFIDANSVNITGYIWQRIPPNAQQCSVEPNQKTADSKRQRTRRKSTSFTVMDNNGKCHSISAGIIFPEAQDLDTSSTWPFLEAYRRQNPNGDITIGWYFDVLLREHFDYRQYPFDIANTWLRIWHRDIDKNIVLVPDIASYPEIRSGKLPGIENNIVLPGWELISTYFDHKSHQYKTQFGIDQYQKKTEFPELHFNIIMKRNFLGSFIGNLMPLLVVAIVLFSLVMMTGADSEKELLGFSFSGVLGASTGLLFGVLIGHTELRALLKAPGLVYLESFYLTMYIFLLLVILNAYIYSKHPSIRVIQWYENLGAKISFWPLLLGCIFLVTLNQFYFSI